MHTIKPLDAEAVIEAAQETSAVATLEEHSVLGGLGSAVAQVLAESDVPKVPYTGIGLESAFAPAAGDQSYLRDLFGLSTEAVVSRLLKLLASRSHA